MALPWESLVGGALPDRRDPNTPPIAAAMTPHVGTLPDEAFITLTTQQYQRRASSCLPTTGAALVESDVRARLGELADLQISIQDWYYGARVLVGEQALDRGSFPDMLARWAREFGLIGAVKAPYNPDTVTTWRPKAEWAAERRKLSCDLQPMGMLAVNVEQEIAAGRGVISCHHVFGQMTNGAHSSGVETSKSGASQGGHARLFVGYRRKEKIEGFNPGVFYLWNWWEGWGVKHPQHATDLRFAKYKDSFSKIPYQLAMDPNWGFSLQRLAKPLNVEV